MPKNIGATRSKLRSRSTRKALRDVSNGTISVNSACGLKKISGEDGGGKGGDSLDRLLLVHSDISSLLRQIDDLVVQVLQSKSNKGCKEIKQFAGILSDMQIALKPWVLIFQKALSGQLMRSDENKPEQSIDQTVVSVPKESGDNVIESPKPTKWESLISPSPLVSWRAQCNIEGGRQLFLLTPLPHKKSLPYKLQASSAAAPRKITSEESAHPVSLLNLAPNEGNNPPDSEPAKPPAINVPVSNPETVCPSPANYSETNCSMFVMTPCLKMSPPKSCILLEPVSEFSRKKNQEANGHMPFTAVVQNSDSVASESSSSRSKVKCPELFGINMNNRLGNKVEAEDSPDWIVSPPKSCTIMEPPDEKLLNNPGIAYTVGLGESMPRMKQPTSTIRKGKHPGENTLKRELWTKFEAASSHGIIHFNHSILQNATEKAFLDRLEEAYEE